MKHSVFFWRKLYWVWTFLFMLLFSHVLRAGVDGGGKVVERHPESRPLVINLTFSLSDYNGFNISCNGLSDGSIDLTPDGGSAPYSYVWSTGALSEDLSGLPAGTYTVTVTDFLGDTQTGSVTLTEPAVIGIMQDSIRADSCGAAADGAVFISVTGGVSPYGYIWSNFALTEDVSGLIAGNYTVLVTDANNCVNQGVFTVTEVPAMILSTTNTNVSCSGGSNGAIDLSVQGGTFPFTYQWSNGGSSQDLSGIPAGTYTLTITDADVCKITTQFSITEPSAINLSATAADVACNGAATGSIDLTAGGGTPGYTFSWSNGSSVEDPAGLLAGTYTVTVTDANLCTAVTSAVINQPAAINLSNTVNNVLCNGGTGGSIDLTVNGGTPGFTYSWSNGSSSQDPSGLSAGTYTVTVTDANLCTAGTSIVVGQPAALSLSTLVTNVSCNSAATGSINLTVAGGTPGYSYAWNNGSISEDPSGLIAGTYTVTVTDANLCTASTSAIVTHPTALSLSTAQVNVACNGASTGSIDLSVSGATPGYTYVWSNGSSNQDVFNLFAGTYTVTVTDANLCTAVTSVNITQPTAFILTASVTNVACNGGSTGSINLTVGGGTPGYTFSWSNGSSSEDPAGLVTGTYTVTVTDANSCTSSNSFVVGQASALSLSATVTNVSCNGAATGSINLTVGGGTPGYTYAWSNGSNSEDPAGLIAGTYTVTVTDANGCTASTVASISQPSAFSLSTSVTALTCNGSANGSINLTVGGGTPGYSFSWSNGSSSEDITALLSGTYTVTVTDANLCTASTSALVTQPSAINLSTTVTNATCNGSATGGINLSVSGGTPGYTYNWSNGNSSEDISGVQSGTYTVTVTDANLCTASISAAISQNQAITISFVPVSGTCNASNGSVTVLPGGGVPGYTFLWSTGSTSQVLTGLAAATYTVTVTDATSCTATSSVSILNTGSPAAALTAGVNVSCNGGSNGSLDITVSGGTPAYSYLWSNGALTQDVSGLVAGTYTVTVTDLNFCVSSNSFTVSQPAALTVPGVVSDVLCNGGSDGSINITATGGTAPYSYVWSNGSLSEDPSGLPAATYTVTVTDVNTCTGSNTFTVGQPSVLTATTSSAQSGCGVSTGSAIVSPAGGTPGYTYLWSTGAVSPGISAVPAGTYTVTVTDANGCTVVRSVSVTSANAPVISSSIVSDVSCNGGSNGGIDITVSAGTPSYTFLWSNGALTEDVSGLVSGTYTVTVTDANNCSVSASYIIAQPTVLTATANITNALCNATATGAIDLNPSGGTGPYTYLWSNAALSEDISGLSAASYTVTVSDVNGCTFLATYTITEPANLSAGAVISDPSCNGAATGSINLSVGGGTSPYSYLWSNGFTGQDPSGLAAASYTVTVTDFNGCSRTRTFIVTQPPAIQATLTTGDENCGAADGTASVAASGGTGTLTYLWSTGSTQPNISGLTAGTYTVTVTDANACTFQGSGTVNAAAGPSISAFVIDSVNCTGGNDGSIDITVNGGAPSYVYQWSNGALTEDVSALPAGVYTVTVSDQNACSVTGSFTVHEPLPIQASFTDVPPSCGASNGSVTVSPSGGTLPYSFLWSNGAVTAQITGVSAGTYTVTISDAKACTAQFSYTLNGSSAPVIDSSQVSDVLCNGGSTGSVTLFVSGGTAPLNFLWSGGQTSQNLTALAAGTYTVTITDGLSCTVTQSYTVTEPSFLSAPVATQPSFCGQATGQAQVNPSGGVSPYTFLWSNGQTTQVISGLSAGTYAVTVTDANGCTRRRNAVVTLSNGPVISLVSQSNITCFGAADGSIDIDVSGGVSPYTYTWSNGALSQDVSGLIAGTYTVLVSDSALCTDSLVVVLTEPGSFTVNATISDASCGLANGSVSLVVGGASPSYTFLWNGGQSTSAISNLSGGSYTVTITDANLCDTTLTYVIGTLSGPSVVVDSVRNIRCFGISNGRIYISAGGGTGPYSYLWSDGNTNEDRFGLPVGTYTVTVSDAGACTAQVSATITQNPQITASFITSQASCNQANGSATVTPAGGVGPYTLLWENGAVSSTINGLTAGIYSVTITDNLGCTFIDSTNVSNSGSPTVQLQNQTSPSCFGGSNGSLTVSVSGGVSPYSIVWSNGDTGLLADSLSAGAHAVTVTDFSGCSELQTFTLIQPDSIQLQFQSTSAYCGQANGTATANVIGGTGTFSYTWSTGATTALATALPAGLFTVTVSDQNACTQTDTISISDISGPQVQTDLVTDASCFGGSNGAISVTVLGGTAPVLYAWSNGQATEDISGLVAGTYTLIVSDSAGCTDTLQATVGQAADIVLQVTVVDASCGNANGSATVTPSGGTPGYTYLWSNGSTTNSIQNVAATNYSVTVTDSNGCTKQRNVTINNQNGPSITLVSMTPASCPGGNNGQIDVDILQGTAPFTYLWSDGSTNQDLSGAGAGVYSLTVTDANSCVNFFVDTVTEPSALLLSFSATNASCNLANGIITAQASGGTAGYTYFWSTGDASSTISGINAGTYTVTVTDAALCTSDSTYTIGNSGVPAITLLSIDSVNCNGGNNGSIDLDVSGGLAPYLYTWINTSQTTQDISNLTAGSYTVIVTDDAGCTATQSYTVGQPAALQISFPLLQNAACGQSNGQVVVSTGGGVPGYTYQWSNASVNDTISNLAAGSYTVTVSDFNGCTASAIANVSNLTGPGIVSIDSGNVSCHAGNDGFINIVASGVSLPLSYQWTGLPDTVPSLNGLTAGSYTLTITDAAGCLLIRTVTLTEPAAFLVNAVITQKNPPYNISCYGLSDGELFLSVNGGTAPYSFVWSNGAISQNLLNLPANTYTVFITDQNNCTTSSTYILSQPPQLVANAGTDFIVCGQSFALLTATPPLIGIGYWQVISSDSVIVFSDSTSASCTISNLGVGDNTLLWTVTDGLCSDDDPITVTSATQIDAIGGIDRKVCGDDVNLNATRPEFGYGYWTALSPGLLIADSLKAFTGVTGLSYGNNSFLWTVVNGTCRDSVVVNIFRRDTLDCLPRIEMPTAFSPNFDGSNDYLIIKGLEEYPDNEIMVYNRWGQVVYRQNNYRNDWYGLDEGGYPLADGTYFIIIRARYIDKVYNTYIDLRR